jgi:hypothetical protein
MNHITIDGALLRNRSLNLVDKLLLSYIRALGNQSKGMYCSAQYFADMISMRESVVSASILKLLQENLIIQTSCGLMLARNWNEIINYTKNQDFQDFTNALQGIAAQMSISEVS